MRRFSGRLRTIVAFENRTTRVFFREEVPKHLLLFTLLKVPCMLLVAQFVQQTKGPPHHASNGRLQEDKNNRN